ncbi:MAG: ABC transporter permease [Acidobacteriaceae bacterium]|nr:ABC transporter permease [Acidobacteriaceae bacterium]
MSTLYRNLRHSLRQLAQQPSFSLAAILSLAFGIGGTVAVFSLTDAILLRPLQFGNESRLVQVWERRPGFSSTDDPVAPGNFADWKTRNHVFTEMGAAFNIATSITGNGRPEQVQASEITANLLPLLGVKPLLGRNFLEEEDRPGANRVALISAHLWQSRYGSDPHITGRIIRLEGLPYAIVGVMPFGFTFYENSQVWIPLAFSPAQLRNRDDHFLSVFGLLRPLTTLDTVRRDLLAISKQLQQEYPAANTGVITSPVLLREQLVGKTRPAIVVLAVGVLIILVTTCANIAGLMVARSTARERELAIKTALGASRFTLFYEQLLESIVLSLCGAIAGVFVATACVPLLQRLVPLSLAAWAHPEIDKRALAFALVTCLLAALGFAFASHGFAAGRSGPALRYGRGAISADRRLFRSALVGGQIALATVILIATGLLGQTFYKLAHTDLGFDPEHVLTMRTELPISDASPYRTFEARASFYKRVLDSVEQLPGVRSAGYTTCVPLTNRGPAMGLLQEGAPPPSPGQWNDAYVRIVTPGYFHAIGARLVAGRFLSEDDNKLQTPAAVITQATARQYWTGRNPIGRRFRFDDPHLPSFTIVGVIANIRFLNVNSLPSPEVYLSTLQDFPVERFFHPRDLAIRVTGDPITYAAAVRHRIWSVDSEQAISNVQTLSAIIDNRLASYDLEARLFGWFAVASLLLSSVGVYGLLSYDVANRTREIGLRMALGAERGKVVGKFVGSALRLGLFGLVAGYLLSFPLAGILRTLLYGVAGWDAPSRILAGCIILIVVLFAAYLPARRAARIDPMEALRAE